MLRRPALLTAYDPDRELPLASYAALVTGFSTLLAAGVRRVVRKRNRTPGLADIALVGIATFEITRTIAKDRVLALIRAPFTRYEGAEGAGDLRETPRGQGLQKAIGQLLTCPYCLAPWVAGALTFALVEQPRATRVVASIFASVAVSHVAQQGYATLREASG